MAALHVSTFRVDVTPPVGAPLCSGTITPVRSVADPLTAIGVILHTDDGPVLICAVDWCEVNNQAHLEWRRELARALDVPPERVALHTVHQHNAPIADLEAQRLVEEGGGMQPFLHTAHFRTCVASSAEAARKARARSRKVDRVATGSVVVKEIASARRILDPDGKVRASRWAATPEPELRAEPEGLIDPRLRTITLHGEDPVVAFHFYATHPMSYYGDGIVTADFAGLARERRCRETPGCEHVFLNGCAGDVTPWKYNDGAHDNRARLTDRMHAALVQSERGMRGGSLGRVAWSSEEMTLPPRRDLVEESLVALVRDQARQERERKSAAQKLAYLQRLSVPTMCSRLRLGDTGSPAQADIVFIPGEPFVEYQLSVADERPFVALAGYGDTGPGYIPLARSYREGGYEIGASCVSEDAEPVLKSAMRRLLSD
jgi:hypothetical protein